MILSSNQLLFKRAQPWLGTLVSLEVGGLSALEAQCATDAAFGEIRTIYKLMSFHEPTSDVSRLNGHRSAEPLAVHPYTFDVLQRALAISDATEGCFDVTVGAELVFRDLLPYRTSWEEGRAADWRAIELRSDNHVRLHRPVCLDLGGIAKGFAVDKATQTLQTWGAERTVVNAGGDLRACGAEAEWVALAANTGCQDVPVLALENGSLASSAARWAEPAKRTVHVDGCTRMPVHADRFVSVVSPECLVADALTKVVMAQGIESCAALQHFGARAYLYERDRGWHSFGYEDQDLVSPR